MLKLVLHNLNIALQSQADTSNFWDVRTIPPVGRVSFAGLVRMTCDLNRGFVWRAVIWEILHHSGRVSSAGLVRMTCDLNRGFVWRAVIWEILHHVGRVSSAGLVRVTCDLNRGLLWRAVIWEILHHSKPFSWLHDVTLRYYKVPNLVIFLQSV